MSEITPALYRSGSGEPLLLLHGFTGAWMHWRPVLEPLAERYEVIAPTLSGHDGGRPYPTGAPLTFTASADELESDLERLGIDTAHMVGNSMGGALALEMAKRGRARSVVALAPAGGWTEGDGEARRLARFFTRQLRMTRALDARLATLVARPKLRRLALRDVMCRGDLVSASDAVRLTQAALACTVAPQAIEALRADTALTLTDLDRISCPVLLASPQFDRILPVERHAPRLRREIPGVEPVTLPGCGHVPMWDDTALVVRTISEFVDRHTTASPPAGDGAASGLAPASAAS